MYQPIKKESDFKEKINKQKWDGRDWESMIYVYKEYSCFDKAQSLGVSNLIS